MTDEESEMILPVTAGPEATPAVDEAGATIGSVHLPALGLTVSRDEMEHLRHEMSHVRAS